MTIDRHDIDAWREAALADPHGAERGIERALAAIATRDSALHAFVHVADDQARVRARMLDAARAAGASPGLLFGVPVAVKDNLCTRGIETTAASRILRGFVPPYDATVVARLEAAGAVIIGKTNLDEFGMGSSTEHSAVGPTRNPWASDRTPGGSSGGSAAAVAAGLVPAALGSDTGGSVRQPAAFCGIVGLKPTYGRVSRYGLLAFASSLDQVGPMTRSSRDAAHVLQVLAGPDAHDATAADVPVPDYASALTGEVGHLRIGVPRRLLAHGVDDGVLSAFEQGLAALRSRGAQIVDCELPHAAQAIPVYYVLACAEASSNLARYDGVRYGLRVDDAQPSTLTAMYERTRDAGFGDEAKRRILLGTYVLSAGYYDAYYRQAQAVRTLIRRDYEAAFAHVDAVAVPTTPTAAFRLGEKQQEPLQMYLADVFTVGPSLAGVPALSVPCGRTAEGLPSGLQLTGRAWQEATLLRLGDAIEQETGWPMHGPRDDGSAGAA